MSRKDFQAIADQIKLIEDPLVRLQAAQAVARACILMNPKFNHDLFFEACAV